MVGDMTKKAIIVGGSMGGLLAGNMLVRQGWEVVILERIGQGLEARGAGITPQRSLIRALEQAGVTLQSDIGIRINKRVAYDRDGVPCDSYNYDQYTTSWGMLYNLLREAFPKSSFLSGRNVTDVIQHGQQVTALLDDGSQIEGDLLIGADGMRSTVRRTLFPDIQPKYVGYVAWRGMLEERRNTSQFIEDTFSSFSFSFPEGEELVCYPVAGQDGSIADGERRFNFMWYRPVDPDEGLRSMFTGTDGVYYENGIPPALIRPELIAAAKEEAARLLPPQFADVVNRTDGLFLQAIYDLVSNEIGAGRVALIGDAAFVARPHCGAGVSKAAADAECLVKSLNDYHSIEQAISAYSVERSKQGRAAVEWAAKLGSYFQMDDNGRRQTGGTPCASREFIVRNTGIELSEAFQRGHLQGTHPAKAAV